MYPEQAQEEYWATGANTLCEAQIKCVGRLPMRTVSRQAHCQQCRSANPRIFQHRRQLSNARNLTFSDTVCGKVYRPSRVIASAVHIAPFAPPCGSLRRAGMICSQMGTWPYAWVEGRGDGLLYPARPGCGPAPEPQPCVLSALETPIRSRRRLPGRPLGKGVISYKHMKPEGDSMPKMLRCRFSMVLICFALVFLPHLSAHGEL